jgi:hypothetical protein
MAIQAHQTMSGSVMPRFEVEQLEGTVEKQVVSYNKEDGRFDYSTKEVPAGYVVYFPQGHSLRIGSTAELKRLGFHRSPGLVDMESGEVLMDDVEPMSLKRRVQMGSTDGKSRRKIQTNISED